MDISWLWIRLSLLLPKHICQNLRQRCHVISRHCADIAVLKWPNRETLYSSPLSFISFIIWVFYQPFNGSFLHLDIPPDVLPLSSPDYSVLNCTECDSPSLLNWSCIPLLLVLYVATHISVQSTHCLLLGIILDYTGDLVSHSYDPNFLS